MLDRLAAGWGEGQSLWRIGATLGLEPRRGHRPNREASLARVARELVAIAEALERLESLDALIASAVTAK